MGFKIVSLLFLSCGIGCLFLMSMYQPWPVYAAGFCFLIAIVTFMVSIMARKGSTMWRGSGQG